MTDAATYIGPLVAVLVALMLASRRRGEIRARGNRVSWANTAITAVVSILITAVAIGVLYAAVSMNRVWTGLGVFAFLMIVGQIGAAKLIARRWPVEIPRR